MKRRICVVTGTRAEFGLLRGVIFRLRDDRRVDLRVVVTGMHLCPDFGLTIREIEDAGCPIHERVDMLLAGDSPAAIAKSIGLGVIGFADVFSRLKPDLLVLLGDRFEALAAAQAAMVARVPIAHIHGGEASEGLIDEAIRHAITKMSHVHFVAAEPYRERVIQLGEEPGRVFNFGSLSVDAIAHMRLMGAEELERSLGFRVDRNTILVTHHPVTLDPDEGGLEFKELLRAMEGRPKNRILFTYPNADTSGRVIIALIREFVGRNADRAIAFPSLGHERYLSAVKHCGVVLGNSSSGLTEAPALGVATVNVGDRQRGRLMASSVIQSDSSCDAIGRALEEALSPGFQEKLKSISNPYGSSGAAAVMADKMASIPLEGLLMKKFYTPDCQ